MKTDIIIPVWNQLEFTKDCIDSVIENTRYPYKLIVVDNGSNAETKHYLEGLKANPGLELQLISNEQNLGFVKAANQGIAASRSEYLCLLNNDTQVTSGWLSEMIKVAASRDDIGIVNPGSNTLGAQQATAQRLKQRTGEYSELAWATGFCMLIKQKVIQEVGRFDEIYGLGNFEDADLSKRAQQKGYFCVCAIAAYVYHRERRSFIKLKRFDQHFERNRRIFHAKWGKLERILYILTVDPEASFKKLDQHILQLARQGHTVWLFLKTGQDKKSAKHSNIYLFSLSKSTFNWVSTWRILKRKKKFDKIYVDDLNYGARLKKLKIFHKAEVIYAK
ncbi:glycosyltransferase family 2 protein [Candidatus Omnitrophota bacterium]